MAGAAVAPAHVIPARERVIVALDVPDCARLADPEAAT